MARKIAEQDEAAESPSVAGAPKGVVFIKNQVNELIKFSDGTTFKFSQPRQTVSDPQLIEKLRGVAERCHIFEAE